MAWLWLVGTLSFGGAAYLVGWPTWSSYRAREARDLNAERYLAWRGRANRGSGTLREGMTGEERRRLWVAGALGVAALVCLVGFFAST
ncbi:MAG TPA: hypothetical protein VHK63_05235 [Candidatus Limnocylindria bacterium]|nr:hypothetical protein [Candidatus Limnocylindria bacterium]